MAFVGRDAELTLLLGALARGERFVSITGPNGVGKSRLAAQLATLVVRGELATAHEARQVSLASCVRVEAAADAICSALGAGEGREGTHDAVLRAGRALADRGPVLVVLDEAERLAPHIAGLVEGLLDDAPEAAFVVTSTARLGAPSEWTFELTPLTLEEGVALFGALTERVRPGYEVTTKERAHVEAIVRELDALPLALELAAPRMAVMGAAALRHRLQSRFEVLRRAPSAGDPRHRALEDTLAFTFDLLEPAERAAAAQCVVFEGGFTVDAAEAVLRLPSGAPDRLEVIQRLREKSILHTAEVSEALGDVRLGMYASLRAFAARELDASGARAQVEARHAEFFLTSGDAWLRALHGSRGAEARLRLGLERENLLAVVERVLDRGPVSARTAEPALRALLILAPVVLGTGPLGNFAALIEPALEVTSRSGADPALQGRGLVVRAALRGHRGEAPGALKDLTKALAIARSLGDRALEADAELELARLLSRAGEARAGEHLERAAAAYEALGDPLGRARVAHRRAQASLLAGRLDEARRAFEDAELQARARGELAASASAARGLAVVALHESDAARVEDAVARAVRASEACGDARGAWMARAIGAGAPFLRGELAQCSAALEEVLPALRDAGFRHAEALVTAALGIVAHASGELAGAASWLQLAHDVGLDGDVLHQTYVDVARALTELDRGNPRAAARVLERVDGARRALRSEGLGLGALVELVQARTDGRVVPSAPSGLFARALLRDPAPRTETSRPTLRTATDASWFELADQPRVSLERRKPLRLLLARLLDAALASPGAWLDTDDLIAAGWPGEKMRADAGLHRVHVALSTLRKLGLREVLRTDEGRYQLDPGLAIERAR